MATPKEASGAARRLSARMGTSMATPARMGTSMATPGPRKPTSTLASLPPTPGAGSRRQTLTGIRTTVAHNKRQPPSANYANPTIASNNKVRDKSPILDQVGSRRKSPNPSAIKSPIEPSYQNVKVERKNSISRDIKRHPVERSTSGSKGRKNRVRRNKSDAESRTRRKEERRYLTIGYPGEVRSPLKERQNNIPANVRRSESDRTPSRAYKSGEIMTRAKLAEVENIENYEVVSNHQINVVRKHSLKCDMLMSPKPPLPPQTPASSKKHVKRAASERSTPKTAPYNRTVRNTPVLSIHDHRRMNMELMKTVALETTPRRSPRFSMI